MAVSIARISALAIAVMAVFLLNAVPAAAQSRREYCAGRMPAGGKLVVENPYIVQGSGPNWEFQLHARIENQSSASVTLRIFRKWLNQGFPLSEVISDNGFVLFANEPKDLPLARLLIAPTDIKNRRPWVLIDNVLKDCQLSK